MSGLTQKDFDAMGRRLTGYGRSLVMGILNVTPDSFSDGGRFNNVDHAVAQAIRMAEEGADIIDIGAESTRPGHEPISASTEIARLTPVLEALRGRINCPISVDTMKAPVAEAALAHGATIINDVWGFKRDPRLAPLAAKYKAAVVLMHNRDTIDPTIDIVEDMLRFLDASLKEALAAGVSRDVIALDPGIGFGKTLEQNLEALAAIPRLKDIGCAILVGASRKSMIGKIIPSETDERLPGTIALHTAAILKGADVIRVHDVKEAVQAARVTDRLRGL
ncbi:MAG: dihydropteroate synthase [Hyphomicrobiales bacterium]|jgi:dihydropteroate synthase|nr:dihydropteroate synthase [Hyphomicrobiales bacterium]